MNDLQKVELELLKVFIDVCNKLELNYFLVCGSCLGAARHGGFIPWDDDMDVGMYREDFNKFMEQAPALLPEGIFLQNYKTDPKFPLIFAKLRNSNTTYVEKACSHLDIHHGVFIDIFPLDGYPTKPLEIKKLDFCEKFYNWLKSAAYELNPNATFMKKFSHKMLRMLGFHKRTDLIISKIKSIKEKYPAAESDRIRDLGTNHKSKFIPKKYFGNGKEILYEGMVARVPEDCDGYLTCLYGDWRKLPPPEKQKGHHFYEICDLERPYTYYTNHTK